MKTRKAHKRIKEHKASRIGKARKGQRDEGT